MSWYGDMLRAGFKVSDDSIELTKELKANGIDYSDLQGAVFKVTANAVDGTDGTAELTLQVVNANGDPVSGLFLLRAWVAGNTDGEPSGGGAVAAITGIAVDTGVEMNEHTNNGDYTVLTDSDGKVVLTLTESAGTIHALATVLGKVETEQVDITS